MKEIDNIGNKQHKGTKNSPDIAGYSKFLSFKKSTYTILFVIFMVILGFAYLIGKGFTINTKSERRAAAEKLLSEYSEFTDYLESNKLSYSLSGAFSEKDSEKDPEKVEQALTYEYTKSRQNDCSKALRGVYNDVLTENERGEFGKENNKTFCTNENIFTDFTKNGFMFTCITQSSDENDEMYGVAQKYFEDFSKGQSDAKKFEIMKPNYPESEEYFYVYIFVEDLTKSRRKVEIDFALIGKVTKENEGNPGYTGEVLFLPKKTITDAEKDFAGRFDAEIETDNLIKIGEWVLLSLDKRGYAEINPQEINLGLDLSRIFIK